MIYRVIGLMSGSSLDGLDMAYVHLQHAPGGSPGESPGGWNFQLIHTACVEYSEEWRDRLAGATALSAREYVLLHTEYGHWVGQQVRQFIADRGLEYQVQLIASHGHTVFHAPGQRMTAQGMTTHGMTSQLGDGAAIAAETGINVVSDLRAMDVALGGQGAPIVPVGDGLLWGEYPLLLNLGGIANVTRQGGPPGAELEGTGAERVAFDVAPANRVLNALAGDAGLAFDRDGLMAAKGRVDEDLLGRLNTLPYYGMGYPKSLANEFGLEEVLPLVRAAVLKPQDALRTYVEHLVTQIGRAVERLGFTGVSGTASPGAASQGAGSRDSASTESVSRVRMLVTGGGAHNGFLVERLRLQLVELGVEVVVPEAAIVDFKEALVMALLGVLRWREENTVSASVTGASRDSIGGAVWIGQ